MTTLTALRGATLAQDADNAKVFAELLNNDLLAIKTLAGRHQFETEDALRINRIWSEYQQLEGAKAASPRAGLAKAEPTKFGA